MCVYVLTWSPLYRVCSGLLLLFPGELSVFKPASRIRKIKSKHYLIEEFCFSWFFIVPVHFLLFHRICEKCQMDNTSANLLHITHYMCYVNVRAHVMDVHCGCFVDAVTTDLSLSTWLLFFQQPIPAGHTFRFSNKKHLFIMRCVFAQRFKLPYKDIHTALVGGSARANFPTPSASAFVMTCWNPPCFHL